MILTLLTFLLQATPNVNPDATPYPDTVTVTNWQTVLFWIGIGAVVGLLILGWKNRYKIFTGMGRG